MEIKNSYKGSNFNYLRELAIRLSLNQMKFLLGVKIAEIKSEIFAFSTVWQSIN